MKWREDLADDWEEAPANPPRTAVNELEIVEVNGGYVACPADAPDEGCVETHSVFSDTRVDVGDDAERPAQ